MTNTTNHLNITSGPAIVSVEKAHAGSPKRIRVETLDFVASVNQRSWALNRRELHQTTRMYGALATFNPKAWGEQEHALVMDALDRENAGTLTGKCPVLAKHQRQGLALALAGVRAALPVLVEVLEKAGHTVVLPTEVGVRFSNKAGCSMCPCSPGHVLDVQLRVDGRPVDVWFE